jgi:hypothetical protein
MSVTSVHIAIFYCFVLKLTINFIRQFHITPHCPCKLCSISHVPFHTAHRHTAHRTPPHCTLHTAHRTLSNCYVTQIGSNSLCILILILHIIPIREIGLGNKACRKLSSFPRCYPEIISSNGGVNITFMGQSRASFFSRLLLRDD